MSEKLKLETNIPAVIALRFSEGKPVQSQFGGDQVMFSLADGRVFFAPEIVAQKINERGITAGQPFSVCRKEILRGTRKMLEYQVERLDGTEAPVSPGAPLNGVPEPSREESLVSSPNHNGFGDKLKQAFVGNGNGNGHNGNDHAVAAAAPDPEPTLSPVPPTIEAAGETLLSRTGKLALDAVLEVERYARFAHHLDGFTFGPDNIQRIWATLYIQATRNGGR